MAPKDTEFADWALEKFLDTTARAVEKQSDCIDKIAVAQAEIKILVQEVVKTLVRIIEIELGAILLLASIKVAEIAGVIG